MLTSSYYSKDFKNFKNIIESNALRVEHCVQHLRKQAPLILVSLHFDNLG